VRHASGRPQIERTEAGGLPVPPYRRAYCDGRPRPRSSDRRGAARADHGDGPRLRGDEHAEESGGFDVTSVRFDEEAFVAVRGAHVSVGAVFRSANVAAIRRDLVEFIRDFEGRKQGRLQTWEDACRFAGEAAEAMSPLITAGYLASTSDGRQNLAVGGLCVPIRERP